VGLLQSGFSSLQILNGSVTLPAVAAGATTLAAFQVTLAPNVAFGTPFSLVFDVQAGPYTATKMFGAYAGAILEDFETNDFTTYSWSTAGNLPWTTTSSNAPYEGLYHAQCGAIASNQSSELLISVNALVNDSVTFWHKESSEQGWDFLKFYIDGSLMGQWSGITTWTYASYPVTVGAHQLRFVYEKDDIVDAGLDLVWLDNIRFPFGMVTTSLSEPIVEESLQLWPNPGNGQVFLRYAVPPGSVWQLFDALGRLVCTGNLSSADAAGTYMVSIPQWVEAGTYLLRVGSTGSVRIQVLR
jgi:hypothetical protein